MKKTLTINLNGIVFHIDDDAYQTLQQYLADIAERLGSGNDTKEIIADIEARIAELFTNMLENVKQEVVNAEMVKNIIHTMGSPSDFGDGEEQPQASKRAQHSPKRFYRNVDNKIIAGVCSGIAAYLGWDSVLVRILFVVMAFFGWWAIIPIYIIFWIVSPAAETAAQRLEMRGENPTVENIKNEISNAKNYMDSDRFRAKATNFGQRFIQAIWCIIKFCFSVFVVLLGFLAFVIIGALLVAIAVLLFGIGGSTLSILTFSSLNLFGLSPWMGTLFFISAILFIGVPIFSLIFALAKYFKTKRGLSSTYNWSALIIWLIATITLLTVGFTQLHWPLSLDSIKKIHHKTATIKTSEIRSVEPFHSVVATGAFVIDLTQNAQQSISVNTDEEILRQIETEVRDSVLYIYADDNMRQHVNVQISNDTFRSLKAMGRCKFHNNNAFRQTNMELILAGASKADMEVQIDSLLIIDVAGGSKIDIDGYAQNMRMKIVGASKVDALDLQSEDADVYCAGASKIKIWCKQHLKAQAYGASKITYKGKPNISEQIAIGASKIEPE